MKEAGALFFLFFQVSPNEKSRIAHLQDPKGLYTLREVAGGQERGR